ncbi:MAG: sensor histidine kinase [Phycisphaerales bacterium]|nr:sensor histidine kinase [Phycisphaerales bacterium]
MLSFLNNYQADLWAFAFISIATAAAVHRWLRKGGHGGLPRFGWAAAVVVIALAALLTQVASRQERDRLRNGLVGLAPTFGQEIELMGHSALTFSTPADDSAYLRMINAEIRWERVNPSISDVYTFRRKSDGQIAFVVDSETDYDHDGHIAGDREGRTAIGEDYPEASEGMQQALDGVANFDAAPVTDRWGTWISAYVPLHTPDGKIDGALGVDFDASVWSADIATHRLGALGLAGLLLAISMSFAAILTITQSEMAKRAGLQRQLVDASRQAGMAEVATGVLHNVGNVLNSVNVSADLLSEKLRDSKIAGFTRAAGMIREHRADFADFVSQDAKGRVLPDYLLKLSELLVEERDVLLGEVHSLARNLGHIKQVVASQQTLAKSVELVETFELGDLIADAMRLGIPATERRGIDVQCDVSSATLVADRHVILQIMVNLITNAVKAVHDRTDPRMTIRAAIDADAPDKVRIDVIDTGIGIKPENLANVFKHGFTTRNDGHGFGLHHSAIAAHNLSGTLSVTSEGPGRGATFTLILPQTASTKGVPCQSA